MKGRSTYESFVEREREREVLRTRGDAIDDGSNMIFDREKNKWIRMDLK